MELSKEQVKEFCLYLDLLDIKAFIQDNQKEFENWLQEEQQMENTKGTYIIYTKVRKLLIQSKYEMCNIKNSVIVIERRNFKKYVCKNSR